MKNIPIGEVLEEKGYVTESQVQEALVYQKKHKEKRLGSLLIEMGFVSEKQVLNALCDKLSLKILPLETYAIDLEAVKKIPKTLAVKYCLLAVSSNVNRLTIVMNDPLNFYAIEDIRLITGMTIDVTLAEKAQIEKTIEVAYSEIEAKQVVTTANTVADASILSLGQQAQREAENSDDQQPVIRLLNSLLIRGYNTNASDIHIEPFENETRIRMRVDGMLIDYLTLARSLHPSLIARTKIMSNLDIAEKRLPQDGHFKTIIDDVDLNIRVSTIPTIYGEKAVLRFLTSGATIDHSNQFGMDTDNYMKFINMLNNPHGIIYITGPTGSGKTTTLYMALEHLAKKQVNISTIEDPVERNLANINQIASVIDFTSRD
ncbi:MAG: ATPase, T2SS/T4P/T4SS family, partial [Oscillospiraceae bacterium]